MLIVLLCSLCRFLYKDHSMFGIFVDLKIWTNDGQMLFLKLLQFPSHLNEACYTWSLRRK